MSEYKEYWIAQGITAIGDDCVWESKPNFETFGNGLGKIKSVIHVIDYQAYQEIKEKLDIAAEALKKIEDNCNFKVMEAERALKKLK